MRYMWYINYLQRQYSPLFEILIIPIFNMSLIMILIQNLWFWYEMIFSIPRNNFILLKHNKIIPAYSADLVQYWKVGFFTDVKSGSAWVNLHSLHFFPCLSRMSTLRKTRFLSPVRKCLKIITKNIIIRACLRMVNNDRGLFTLLFTFKLILSLYDIVLFINFCCRLNGETKLVWHRILVRLIPSAISSWNTSHAAISAQIAAF